MRMYDWVSNHEGGLNIGNICNSAYVENYMTLKYADWYIMSVHNNVVYHIWEHYVNQNIDRLTAFYNHLYNRAIYNFGKSFEEIYRSEKENVNKIDAKHTTITNKNEDSKNNEEYNESEETKLKNDNDHTITRSEQHKELPNTVKTETLGEFTENVINTEFKVAIDSYEEKETEKTVNNRTQPETINTETTTGTNTNNIDGTTTDIGNVSENVNKDDYYTRKNEKSVKENENQNKSIEENVNENEQYSYSKSGYNGKTESEYIIDSLTEFNAEPINMFIDRFVRGYFTLCP